MFIFGNTSQELELLSYVGIKNCENCRRDAHHGLYRTVGKASVYLFPVAKWEKARFLLCSGCEAGSEVTVREAAKLQEGASNLPEASRYADVWNCLGDAWDAATTTAEARADGKLDFDTLMRVARAQAEARYPKSQVDAVVGWSFLVTQLQHFGVLEEARSRINWPNILSP